MRSPLASAASHSLEAGCRTIWFWPDQLIRQRCSGSLAPEDAPRELSEGRSGGARWSGTRRVCADVGSDWAELAVSNRARRSMIPDFVINITNGPYDAIGSPSAQLANTKT